MMAPHSGGPSREVGRGPVVEGTRMAERVLVRPPARLGRYDRLLADSDPDAPKLTEPGAEPADPDCRGSRPCQDAPASR
jgi:hypothetical protein